jgi:hypothetical protein
MAASLQKRGALQMTKKLQTSTLILGALIIVCVALPLALWTLTSSDAGRLLFLVLCIVGILTTFIAWQWGAKTADIPAGSAGIVMFLNQRQAVKAGPQKVTYFPLLQSVDIKDLTQKPWELTREYDTGDYISIRLTLSIIWEVQPDSLYTALDDNAKLTDGMARLIDGSLTFQIGSRSLADMRANLIAMMRDLVSTLNSAPASKGKYVVKQAVATQLKLPAELLQAYTQLEIARVKQSVAQLSRADAYDDRVAEANAQAEELKVLDKSIGKVQPRTIDHAESLAFIRQLRGQK